MVGHVEHYAADQMYVDFAGDKLEVVEEMTVGKNCYVSLFKHHYSLPREHVGKRVVIFYDADTVDIYCGLNLVATHDRRDIPYTYTWKKEHNLPGHYGPYDKDLELSLIHI